MILVPPYLILTTLKGVMAKKERLKFDLGRREEHNRSILYSVSIIQYHNSN